MLLGIWGPSSVGKTYFTRRWISHLVCISNWPISLVEADSPVVWNLKTFTEDGEPFWDRASGDKPRWKGKKADKLHPHPPSELMADRERIWIIESVRYFNGLWPHITEACQELGGGFRLMVVIAQGPVHHQFLIDRKGGELSPYWTPENCWKESQYRANNFYKHYEPAGVVGKVVEIGPDRLEWLTEVLPLMEDWLTTEDWY